MAKDFRIPYIVREITRELERALGIRLGVPMNAKIPPFNEGEEFVDGKMVLHFPGAHFNMVVATAVGHYGQYVGVRQARASLSAEHFSEKVITDLSERLAAQGIAWERSGTWEKKLHFSLSGAQLWALRQSC